MLAPFDRRTVDAKRLDGFMDAVFAFAVTLLVIAGASPPTNVEELTRAIGRLPAFAASLVVIMTFWLAHRRFGTLATARDQISDSISMAILLVVLVYVYPLRLLSESVFHWASQGRLPGRGLLLEDLRHLYTIYGAGFAVLAALYAALFGYARLAGARLGVHPEDRDPAREAALIWAGAAAAGAASVALAQRMDLVRAPWLPGLAYAAIPALTLLRPLLRGARPEAPVAAKAPVAPADGAHWNARPDDGSPDR